MARFVIFFLMLILLNSSGAAAQAGFRRELDTSGKKINLRVLPQNFYNQHLSFFCKKEVQLQKLTSLPLFIRLGSKEYVDYLERKPNSFVGRRER
ncbi:MAG: hypothetical protein ACTHMD_11235 [Flavisolibacter sp.]